MDIRLNDHFEGAALQRGRDYARRGLVVGVCSCPVGHNCKHVAAVLMKWAAQQDARPGLAAPVQGWLSRVKERATAPQLQEQRPEDYPDKVKDRLLYVLMPSGAQLRVDIYKGRINAAGTALNKSIRRYDAAQALRSTAPAKFIRPVDLDLLSALAQARLWDASHSYGLPDLLRPRGDQALALIRRLCDTGRFLHTNAPDAHLAWSETRRDARLGWRMAADGSQQLGFEDASGAALQLRGLDGATLWIDTDRGASARWHRPWIRTCCALSKPPPRSPRMRPTRLARPCPRRWPGLPLPRPRSIRQTRRAARQRIARLTLGAETAHDGPRYFGSAVQLPTLTLRFVYDGQEVGKGMPIRAWSRRRDRDAHARSPLGSRLRHAADGGRRAAGGRAGDPLAGRAHDGLRFRLCRWRDEPAHA